MKRKKTKKLHQYHTEVSQKIDKNFNEKNKKQNQTVLKDCSKTCLKEKVECPFKECGHWIDFKEDKNCDLISIETHGNLTLRQIGERLGVSYVRIKQIEDAAIKKLKKHSSSKLLD